MSDDPKVCVNCHIGFIRKCIAKGGNGYHHSLAAARWKSAPQGKKP